MPPRAGPGDRRATLRKVSRTRSSAMTQTNGAGIQGKDQSSDDALFRAMLSVPTLAAKGENPMGHETRPMVRSKKSDRPRRAEDRQPQAEFLWTLGQIAAI